MLWKLRAHTSLWPHRQPGRCRRKGQYSAYWVSSLCRRQGHPLSVTSVWHSLLFLSTGLFFLVWDGSSAPVGNRKRKHVSHLTRRVTESVFSWRYVNVSMCTLPWYYLHWVDGCLSCSSSQGAGNKPLMNPQISFITATHHSLDLCRVIEQRKEKGKHLN